MSGKNPFVTPEDAHTSGGRAYTEGDEPSSTPGGFGSYDAMDSGKKPEKKKFWTKAKLFSSKALKMDTSSDGGSPAKGRAGRAATDPADYGRTENTSPNGAGPSGAPFDPQATLPAFYELVSSIKEQLNNVDEQKMEMMALHDIAKKLTKTPELQQAQKDMATLVMSIKKNLSDADKGIKTVQKSNEHDFVELIDAIDVDAPEEEIEIKKEALTSVFQMRAQVTISLVAKFDKTCSSFKAFEQQVSEEYHEAVKRRLQIVTNEVVDDDKVDELIDNGQAETLFKQAMLQNRGQAIAEFSAAVQERHEGMQKLYKDLLELHQMMLDFSVLVYEQGKMIDSIADQVSSTAEYIRRGTDQLLRAKAHKKTANKFKSAAMLTVGGVAAAGAALIGLTVAGLAAPLAV